METTGWTEDNMEMDSIKNMTSHFKRTSWKVELSELVRRHLIQSEVEDRPDIRYFMIPLCLQCPTNYNLVRFDFFNSLGLKEE